MFFIHEVDLLICKLKFPTDKVSKRRITDPRTDVPNIGCLCRV